MLRRKNASLQGGACLSFAPRLLPIGRGTDSMIPARETRRRNADPARPARKKSVETRRATSLAIWNVRGISVSSTKSCRDAFLRLGTRDCRMKLAIAEAWRFAETQECVSTGGGVFVFCAASLANQAWRFHDSRQGRRGAPRLYIVRAERDSPRPLSAAPFSRVFREIIAKK